MRLETHPEPSVQLDLLMFRPDLQRYTVIELKCLTALWTGVVEGETYALKKHSAQDDRAYDVVKDLTRVERFVAGRPGWNGLVVALSNNPAYWLRPQHGRDTNAQAFRLYEGTTLQGVRAWGPRTGMGTMKRREAPLELRGSYVCSWLDYSELVGSRGKFRLLIFAVD